MLHTYHFLNLYGQKKKKKLEDKRSEGFCEAVLFVASGGRRRSKRAELESKRREDFCEAVHQIHESGDLYI